MNNSKDILIKPGEVFLYRLSNIYKMFIKKHYPTQHIKITGIDIGML